MPAPDLWRTAARALSPDAAGVSDADLLARFRDARDEAAFELLVYRHGQMVWATCRRLLREGPAAEDAFQATFLALARRARSVRTRSVPAWLHRVAARAGLYLLRQAHRRSVLPGPHADAIDPRPGPADRAAGADAAAHIDAAVDRLPDRLRRVVVLCELRGLSLREAAAELRCPVGTVASRLARARARLREVLSARGLAGGTAGGWAVAESVPQAVRAAALKAAGGTGVRPGVAALAARAGRPAGRAAVVALAGSLAVGLVVVTLAVGGPDQSQPPSKSPAKDPPPAAAVRTDAEGIPLPDGAVARLGSSRFRHNGQPVASVVFSPDGRLVACPHNRGGVSVFEVATGRTLFRFRVPEKHYPSAARFLADGKHLAVGSMEYHAAELTVYALADGKPTATPRFDTTGKGTDYVKVIDVTTDGSRVLVDDLWGQGIYLRDLKTGKDIWRFEVSEVVYTKPFTADGKWLAVAASSKVELRDAATGETAAVFPDPGPDFKDRYNTALAHDGRGLVVAKKTDALAVLDPKGAVPVRTFPARDQGLVRGLISPDGRYLVGLGQMVSPVWDLAAKDDQGPIARLPGAWSGEFSPDGKTLALDNDGIVTLVGTGDWKPLLQSADPPSPVFPVRFTPDGRRVVGHTSVGWVSWPASGGAPTLPAADAARHCADNVDVSPDGRVAIETVSVPGETPGKWTVAFQITDLTTGATRRTPRDDSNLRPPRLSPDGRFVATYEKDSEFTVRDLSTGAVVFRRPASPKDVLLTAIPTADGRGLAVSATAVRGEGNGVIPEGPRYTSFTVTDHRTSRSWNIDPTTSAGTPTFSPDRSRLVISRLDLRTNAPWRGEVSVWDVRSGRRLVTWPRPGGVPGRRDAIVDPVTLSPDNRVLLVGDAAGLLSLVEVVTGKERAAFRHAGGVLAVAFHPDGTRAVSSGPEGPVYVWDLLGDPGRWDAVKADAVWADLASADAKTAFAAVRKLRANPAEAVGFLGARLKVPIPPTDEALAGLLRRLDNPRFADREKAQRELADVADLVRPRLEAARKTASEETGRRLDQVLKAADDWAPDKLRQVRACEVLEGIGTPNAVKLLKVWATGPPGARLTVEATESLGRISK